jgi:RecB family exonuclease
MENLPDRLRDLLRDRRSVLVFPSEVAARSWSEYLLLNTDLTALREDRLISWDTFKQQVFPRHDESEPANQIHRMLFVQQFLEQNRVSPVLHYIIRKDYRDQSKLYSSSIIKLLGALETLLSPGQDVMTSRSLRELRADLQTLYQAYAAFLEKHNLFEPAYCRLEMAAQEARRYVLCHSSVYQGFAEYRQALLDAEAVQFFETGDIRLPELAVYENQLLEILGTFERVEQLLLSGVSPEDITITACDYERMYEDLSLQARLRGLPLRFRRGRKLLSFPAARLFRDIRLTVAQEFSLDTVKRLLLSPAYRWKDPELNSRLVRFGIEASCLRNTGGRGGDIWEQRLTGSGESDLLSHYRKLKNHLRSLVTSADVNELWKQVHAIQQVLIEPYERENETEAERIFSYCIDQLEQVRETITALDGVSCTDPYGLWLTVLEQTWYVPQQGHDGISVYPYGVSAGIQSAHHFIIGADSEHTALFDHQNLPLSEEHQEQLGLMSRDLTQAMIETYSSSGGDLRFSCSRRTRDSVVLPAGLFRAQDRIREITEHPFADDPYNQELELWSGRPVDTSARWYPLQLNGFETALHSSLSNGGLDLGRRSAGGDHPASRLAWKILTSSERMLQVSPTSLDRFITCPFSYLTTYVLKLEERDFQPDLQQARRVGTLIHRCYEQFFTYLKQERAGVFDAAALDEYRVVMEQIIDRQLKRLRKRADGPAEAAFWRLRRFIRDQVPLLLDQECTRFDQWITEELELEASCIDTERQIEFTGRIDRLSIEPESRRAALIDYKKKNHTSPKSFSEAAAGPVSYQLPMYLYLVEHSDSLPDSVTDALYYDVTEGSYVSVLPNSRYQITRERFDQLIQEMLGKADGMREALRELKVTTPSSCVSCRFRDVCRGRYSIR